MKRGLGIIIVVAAIAAIAGVVLVGSSRQSSNQASDQPVTDINTSAPAPSDGGGTKAEGDQVTIQGFAFKPETIKVKKGTTVTWTNQDSAKHNVVSTEDSPAKGLNGPLLSKGQTYSYTFTQVGTYSYLCEPHPYMKATVEVTE
ncbi:MAG TPA: cupredoxin family copper-binding protein [Candidatus Saccharimonadales bacterium]|nr:cupredoxin family copper-binding protein [Candidatus Saccharimonadales bacterium]